MPLLAEATVEMSMAPYRNEIAQYMSRKSSCDPLRSLSLLCA